MSESIGMLVDKPPYRAWGFWTGVWAIQGAGGWNCWGLNGAVLLPSRELAEEVIRSHGHEPAAPIIEERRA